MVETAERDRQKQVRMMRIDLLDGCHVHPDADLSPAPG